MAFPGINDWTVNPTKVTLVGSPPPVGYGDPTARLYSQYDPSSTTSYDRQGKLFGWDYDYDVGTTTLAVGYPCRDYDNAGTSNLEQQGGVITYTWNGTTFTEQQRIDCPHPETFANFGYKVSIAGEWLLVTSAHQKTVAGATYDGLTAGRVYLFRFQTGTWSLHTTYEPEAGDVAATPRSSATFGMVGTWVRDGLMCITRSTEILDLFREANDAANLDWSGYAKRRWYYWTGSVWSNFQTDSLWDGSLTRSMGLWPIYDQVTKRVLHPENFTTTDSAYDWNARQYESCSVGGSEYRDWLIRQFSTAGGGQFGSDETITSDPRSMYLHGTISGDEAWYVRNECIDRGNTFYRHNYKGTYFFENDQFMHPVSYPTWSGAPLTYQESPPSLTDVEILFAKRSGGGTWSWYSFSTWSANIPYVDGTGVVTSLGYYGKEFANVSQYIGSSNNSHRLIGTQLPDRSVGGKLLVPCNLLKTGVTPLTSIYNLERSFCQLDWNATSAEWELHTTKAWRLDLTEDALLAATDQEKAIWYSGLSNSPAGAYLSTTNFLPPDGSNKLLAGGMEQRTIMLDADTILVPAMHTAFRSGTNDYPLENAGGLQVWQRSTEDGEFSRIQTLTDNYVTATTQTDSLADDTANFGFGTAIQIGSITAMIYGADIYVRKSDGTLELAFHPAWKHWPQTGPAAMGVASYIGYRSDIDAHGFSVKSTLSEHYVCWYKFIAVNEDYFTYEVVDELVVHYNNQPITGYEGLLAGVPHIAIPTNIDAGRTAWANDNDGYSEGEISYSGGLLFVGAYFRPSDHANWEQGGWAYEFDAASGMWKYHSALPNGIEGGSYHAATNELLTSSGTSYGSKTYNSGTGVWDNGISGINHGGVLWKMFGVDPDGRRMFVTGNSTVPGVDYEVWARHLGTGVWGVIQTIPQSGSQNTRGGAFTSGGEWMFVNHLTLINGNFSVYVYRFNATTKLYDYHSTVSDPIGASGGDTTAGWFGDVMNPLGRTDDMYIYLTGEKKGDLTTLQSTKIDHFMYVSGTDTWTWQTRYVSRKYVADPSSNYYRTKVWNQEEDNWFTWIWDGDRHCVLYLDGAPGYDPDTGETYTLSTIDETQHAHARIVTTVFDDATKKWTYGQPIGPYITTDIANGYPMLMNVSNFNGSHYIARGWLMTQTFEVNVWNGSSLVGVSGSFAPYLIYRYDDDAARFLLEFVVYGDRMEYKPVPDPQVTTIEFDQWGSDKVRMCAITKDIVLIGANRDGGTGTTEYMKLYKRQSKGVYNVIQTLTPSDGVGVEQYPLGCPWFHEQYATVMIPYRYSGTPTTDDRMDFYRWDRETEQLIFTHQQGHGAGLSLTLRTEVSVGSFGRNVGIYDGASPGEFWFRTASGTYVHRNTSGNWVSDLWSHDYYHNHVACRGMSDVLYMTSSGVWTYLTLYGPGFGGSDYVQAVNAGGSFGGSASVDNASNDNNSEYTMGTEVKLLTDASAALLAAF